jgi:hypothetical protein
VPCRIPGTAAAGFPAADSKFVIDAADVKPRVSEIVTFLFRSREEME